MAGSLYYSEVYPQVKAELIARGNAGATSRSTRDLSYMLEKVANVELRAYDKQPTSNSTPISILGGKTVLEGSFLPTGPNGFLNRSPISGDARMSYRTAPYIKEISIDINDNKGFVNKLTAKIVIPDPSAVNQDANGVSYTDFDIIESVYLLPGRDVLAIIQHPESAILSDPALLAKLEDSPLTGETQLLKVRYPTLNSTELKRLNKLNELYFNGKISGYSFEYTSDGSVEVSIDAIGTSNTYADISILSTKQKNKTGNPDISNTRIGQFYTDIILPIITASIKNNETKNINDYEEFATGVTGTKSSSCSILVGQYYKNNDGTETNTQKKMITLGYLIELINKNILSNVQNEYINIEIRCEDGLCKSNYYEQIVSINSDQILLWPGKSSARTNFLGHFDKTIKQHEEANLSTPKLLFPNVKPVTDGFLTVDKEGNKYANPARIYIDIEQIRTIIDDFTSTPETATVKNFLTRISKLIFNNTAGAVDMRLVQDSQLVNELLFYDVNYTGGTTTQVVQEFLLPAFASKTARTVVRDFKLSSKIPEQIRELVYKDLATEASEEPAVSYIPYFYAVTEEQRKQQLEKWKTEHETAVSRLNDTKLIVASKISDDSSKANLKSALKRYIRHFDPDIKKCSSTVKVPYPLNLEFTIDGINGLKFGDVLSFSGLPKRYSDNFVFNIQKITHNVSNTGEWTTTIGCIPRFRIR